MQQAMSEELAVPKRDLWVVDDSLAFRLIVQQVFGRAGWSVTEFPILNSALDSLAVAPAPDVVLLDIHLPDGNGLDSISAFEERGMAVVVVSNLVGAEQTRRAFAAGAVDIVTKPVNVSVLMARVERAAGLTGATDPSVERTAIAEVGEIEAADVAEG